MDLLKDYDFTLQYHPSKSNVVVVALSYKPRQVVPNLVIQEWRALETLLEFDLLPVVAKGRKQFRCLVV